MMLFRPATSQLQIRSLFILLLSVSPLAILAGSSTCRDLGFTGEQLCSDCDSLGEYVKDAELLENCKSCCVEDEAVQKFTSAILEVCPYRMNSFPQIKDFIDKKAKSYPGLKVRMEMNANPKLKLKGPSGSETTRIDNWKTSQLEEFLKMRLEPAHDAAAA